MTVFLWIALLAWGFLLLFRGGFWRADQRLAPAPTRAQREWPFVAVIIPARNEAETIGEVVARHAQADYQGILEIVVVDDGSDDGTGDIARAAGRSGRHGVTVIAAPPLRPGWSGKLAAVQAGLDHLDASGSDAAAVLLTDADIAVGSSLLSGLVARMRQADLSLVSVMARLDARGAWGSLLIPAFIFFFQKLYPFPKVNDPASGVAGAAGGVVLVRRAALEAMGGMAAIKGALIDDCALGTAIKSGPPRRRIELVLADHHAEATSLRDNRAYGSIRDMVARTAFTQLGYSGARLAGTTAGMIFLYLLGPLAVLTFPLHREGTWLRLGLAIWGLMTIAYWPTVRLYGKPFWQALTLPLAGALYGWFTILSALRHWRGQGGRWKGRTYPAPGQEA